MTSIYRKVVRVSSSCSHGKSVQRVAFSSHHPNWMLRAYGEIEALTF